MDYKNDDEQLRRQREELRRQRRRKAVIFVIIGVALAMEQIKRLLFPSRAPYLGETLHDQQETHRIIGASDRICREQIKLSRKAFFSLCKLVKDRGVMFDTRLVSLEEQMVMFLRVLGFNHSNRDLAHEFSHSNETVSRHFNFTLNAIIKLHPVLLKPPCTMEYQAKYYPFFKDCIGAIDGSLVPAMVVGNGQRRFQDRKGNITQNILAACDHDHKFTYILAGWEGSASDSRVFEDALHRNGESQLKVPEGKFFLVDAHFPNRKGFLRPYRCSRYHLKEWQNCSESPKNLKELFNLRHSSVRNVINRTFGMLKRRFNILRVQADYPYKTQVKIVLACALLHNFILTENTFEEELQWVGDGKSDNDDEDSSSSEDSESDEESDEDPPIGNHQVHDDVAFNPEHFRDDIAQTMWDAWDGEVNSNELF